MTVNENMSGQGKSFTILIRHLRDYRTALIQGGIAIRNSRLSAAHTPRSLPSLGLEGVRPSIVGESGMERARNSSGPCEKAGILSRRELTRGGSWPVSRVLSWAAIHLGHASPRASSDLPGSRAGRTLALPYLVLLRVGFALPPPVTGDAVRSYRTFSPFPPTREPKAGGWGVVCFLWHFPSARAAQALPGTLPFGARTFLVAPTRIARHGYRMIASRCSRSSVLRDRDSAAARPAPQKECGTDSTAAQALSRFPVGEFQPQAIQLASAPARDARCNGRSA